MGTSVVRPLADAHGGYSKRSEEAGKIHDAPKADTTDRERNEQLSVRFNTDLNDQLSEKPERSAVGSQLVTRNTKDYKDVAGLRVENWVD
jgi:hypothetical protein